MKAAAWAIGIVTAVLVALMIAGSRLPADRGVGVATGGVPSDRITLLETSSCSPSNSEPQPPIERYRIESALNGVNQEAVCGLIGAPNRTSKAGEREYWYFERISRDPVTGKIDRSIQVVFELGIVSAINFH